MQQAGAICLQQRLRYRSSQYSLTGGWQAVRCEIRFGFGDRMIAVPEWR